jgi:L-threonylcarbamoyladenylate synthase
MNQRLLPEQDDAIRQAVEVLRSGGLLLYPTDTVWGLGCDATNERAVERLVRLKGKEEGQGLIVLLDDMSRIQRYTRQMPEVAWDLIELSVKPLTLVLDGGSMVADGVLGPERTIAIRVTKDPVCRELVRRLRKPLVSTSANPAGKPTPAGFSEISESLKTGVDYILPLRQSERKHPIPSTVIRLKADGQIRILRK